MFFQVLSGKSVPMAPGRIFFEIAQILSGCHALCPDKKSGAASKMPSGKENAALGIKPCAAQRCLEQQFCQEVADF